MVTAFSVWARTVYLAGRHHGVPRHKLPALLRRPWAVGIAGLLAPGLGLAAGRLRPAGCGRDLDGMAGGRGGPGAGQWLRRSGCRNQRTGRWVHSIRMFWRPSSWWRPGTLVVGLIGWMAQALEGARQMMGEPGIRHRMRGDWYAAALLCRPGVAWRWPGIPPAWPSQLDTGSGHPAGKRDSRSFRFRWREDAPIVWIPGPRNTRWAIIGTV